MADGKRKHEFDVAVCTVCYIDHLFAGEWKPLQANPYREFTKPEDIRTEEQRQSDTDMGFRMMEVALCSMFGRKPRSRKKDTGNGDRR